MPTSRTNVQVVSMVDLPQKQEALVSNKPGLFYAMTIIFSAFSTGVLLFLLRLKNRFYLIQVYPQH